MIDKPQRLRNIKHILYNPVFHVSSAAVFLLFLCSAVFAAPYKEGELLVRFKKGVNREAASRAHAKVGATVKRKFRALGVEHIGLKPGLTVKEALDLYKAQPNVEHAEPNYIVRVALIPDDPDFIKQWGLHNTGQIINVPGVGELQGTEDADIDAPEAWDLTTGSNTIVVAVVDSGVDYNHEDLAANIWANVNETCGNGVDDDNNGYIDDCRGWDFVNKDNDPMDDNIFNGVGHGTHVVGIIGASGNNGIGVAGISWTVSIMPLKILDAGGEGTVADEIHAIEYAVDNGADVINASFGDYYENSTFEKEAIDLAGQAGVLFVAAAGNDGSNNDETAFYPASHSLPNVISVAASDFRDNFAFSFSNFGSASVHLAAPGENIYSTQPSNLYEFKSGSSMATSFVSGTVALLLAKDPDLSAFEARELILTSVDRKEYAVITGGRLNAGSALNSDISLIAPAAPSHLRASAVSESEIKLSWVDNSTVEDGFIIERMEEGDSFGQIVTLGANATSYTDTGLAEGTTYHYRASAYNANGDSQYGTISINSSGFPVAPSNLAATTVSKSEIKLSWVDNSTVEDGFIIERMEEGGSFGQIATLGANVTSYIDTGLAANTTYHYRASAYNANGDSSFSNVAVATTPRLQESDGNDGWCFIATAAYGSRLAPEVKVLRRFRDRHLLKFAAGRKIVRYYYRYSPPLAGYISGRPPLKFATRAALTPFVYGIKHPFAGGALALFVLVAIFYRRRKPRKERTH